MKTVAILIWKISARRKNLSNNLSQTDLKRKFRIVTFSIDWSKVAEERKNRTGGLSLVKRYMRNLKLKGRRNSPTSSKVSLEKISISRPVVGKRSLRLLTTIFPTNQWSLPARLYLLIVLGLKLASCVLDHWWTISIKRKLYQIKLKLIFKAQLSWNKQNDLISLQILST